MGARVSSRHPGSAVVVAVAVPALHGAPTPSLSHAGHPSAPGTRARLGESSVRTGTRARASASTGTRARAK